MEETGFDRKPMDAVQAETPDLETLLRQRRDYQSAFDKKVSSALQTARANWEREQAVGAGAHTRAGAGPQCGAGGV